MHGISAFKKFLFEVGDERWKIQIKSFQWQERLELEGYLEGKINKLIFQQVDRMKEKLGFWFGNCEPVNKT